MRDIAVITERLPITAWVERLLGFRLDARWDHIWSPSHIFGLGQNGPALVVLDVLKLSPREGSLPPPMRSCPNVLVVGLDEDSDLLMAAWNEGIPAYPLGAVKAQTLVGMAAGVAAGCEFYDFFGRLAARGIHALLARRFEEQILTEQEKAVVGQIRLGRRNARIARELRIEEKTVKNHVYNVFRKLGVSRRYELIARSAALPFPWIPSPGAGRRPVG